MELLTKPNEDKELGILVCFIALGLCEAIKKDMIQIEEAERLLFYPGLVEKLKKGGLSSEFIKIIHNGTELENVLSLLPKELPKALDDLQNDCFKLIKKHASSIVKKDSRWLQVIPRQPEN